MLRAVLSHLLRRSARRNNGYPVSGVQYMPFTLVLTTVDPNATIVLSEDEGPCTRASPVVERNPTEQRNGNEQKTGDWNDEKGAKPKSSTKRPCVVCRNIPPLDRFNCRHDPSRYPSPLSRCLISIGQNADLSVRIQTEFGKMTRRGSGGPWPRQSGPLRISCLSCRSRWPHRQSSGLLLSDCSLSVAVAVPVSYRGPLQLLA